MIGSDLLLFYSSIVMIVVAVVVGVIVVPPLQTNQAHMSLIIEWQSFTFGNLYVILLLYSATQKAIVIFITNKIKCKYINIIMTNCFRFEFFFMNTHVYVNRCYNYSFLILLENFEVVRLMFVRNVGEFIRFCCRRGSSLL